MLEDFPRSDTFPGIENESLDEEIDALGTDGAETAHVGGFLPHRDDVAGDGVGGEGGDARPDIFGGGADCLADEGDLLDFTVSGQVRGADDEFCEDETHGPDVDCAAVVVGAEEELGGSVPARDDVGGHLHSGVGEGASEAKIGELDFAVGGDEKIVRLDVAVQDEVEVAEPDSSGEHPHPGFDVRRAVADFVGIADEHLEVPEGEVLEDEVEVLVFGGEDGEEADDVLVVEFLEVLQFADGVGGEAVAEFFLHFDFLNRYQNRLVVSGMAQVDIRISTFSKFLAFHIFPLFFLVHLL